MSLIKEIHALIMNNAVRSDDPNPGSFRTSQNAIGDLIEGKRVIYYYPPPPTRINELMENLVKYIHNRDDDLPDIFRIALIHYQFEAIHPFCDGNGRVGRTLVSLLLWIWRVVDSPFIHLGEYFNQNQEEYKKALLEVTKSEDFTEWFKFCLKGIESQAKNASNLWGKVTTLRKDYFQAIKEDPNSHMTDNMQKIFDAIISNPIFTIKIIERDTSIKAKTIYGIVKRLIKRNIIVEDGKANRSKKYRNPKLLEILETTNS